MLVISAVVGLIGLQRDSSNGAVADGISHGSHSSGPSAGTTPTMSPPLTHQARVADQRGDTTGPDLLAVSAFAGRGVLRVRMTLAAPVTADVVLRVFIDADSDRTTGSLSFPCSAATLGADYEIATRGHSIDHFMASVADGCATPFKAESASDLTIRVAGDRVNLGIPTSALRRPNEHLIGLYTQALRTTGGQIDSCPGQHDRPVSVEY